jgi:hypothetical protein
MVAVLASPGSCSGSKKRSRAPQDEPISPLDEYALASRLSYFLWSSMPDQELFDLASGASCART